MRVRQGKNKVLMRAQEMEKSSCDLSHQLAAQHNDVNTITLKSDGDTVQLRLARIMYCCYYIIDTFHHFIVTKS